MPAALMKAARETRREGEDRRGASGATDEKPWRWRARADALAGQRRHHRVFGGGFKFFTFLKFTYCTN